MTSQLNVDTIKGKSTEGSISIQGEGTKTTNLQQGLLKAFINFDGDTASATANLDGVNQSFNVTSLVDNTTGDYSINFTNNMGNDDVNVSGHAPSADTLTTRQWAFVTSRQKSEITASSVRVTSAYTFNANQVDFDGTSVNFHGDLA
tara:strand:+ start:73 stop:513 length:441 start_codon:yes stop_codon:yes gene_type:complete